MTHRRVCGAPLRVSLVGGLLAMAAVVLSSPSAWAMPHPPIITELGASPATLSTLDGTSSISAYAIHATSCSLSAMPNVLSGTGAVSCTGGTSQPTVVTFPENASATKDKKYTITFTATGAGGRKAKKVTVTVLPGAGGS